MQEILTYLQTTWLENLGIIATLICVWLNIKQNIWGWFWAVISSGIYGIVYFQSNLYSDMELQIVFIIISIYGWWQWFYGSNEKDNLPVSKTPIKYLPFLLLILLVFTGLSGYFHGKYTNASFPYFDSTLTAASLIAQWLLARKYIENWILWIVANVGYVAMYFSKNLFGTSFLYVLLLAMAVKGYFDWRKSMGLISK
jgi:nicotinamide mononucleotide transporter